LDLSRVLLLTLLGKRKHVIPESRDAKADTRPHQNPNVRRSTRPRTLRMAMTATRNTMASSTISEATPTPEPGTITIARFESHIAQFILYLATWCHQVGSIEAFKELDPSVRWPMAKKSCALLLEDDPGTHWPLSYSGSFPPMQRLSSGGSIFPSRI
jgi:hypothetical protein